MSARGHSGRCLSCLGLLLVVLGGPRAGVVDAQESDHSLELGYGWSELSCEHGVSSDGNVALFLSSASDVSAFSVAVCNVEALVTLVEIIPEPALDGAELVETAMADGGGTLTAVFDSNPPFENALTAGREIQVASLAYCCNGEITCSTSLQTPLTLCDGTLGEPPWVNELISGDTVYRADSGLELRAGVVECVGECPPSEICNDGIDNDGDGLVDREDDECQETDSVGRQLPGDCNQDGDLDLSDALCLFGHLFLGFPRSLPCTDDGNLQLLDWQADDSLDLSDGISLLTFLFDSTSLPHALAVPGGESSGCIGIRGCPDIRSCRSDCVPPLSACPRSVDETFVANDFIRGDADGDGQVTVTDGVFVLNYLCLDGPEPQCRDAADFDDSGCINPLDVQLLLSPAICPLSINCALPPPFPEPGPDVGIDALDCIVGAQ